jgi:hypothetical protein
MSNEVAYVLIVAFIVIPLVLLVFLLMTAMKNGWFLQSALISLPF